MQQAIIVFLVIFCLGQCEIALRSYRTVRRQIRAGEPIRVQYDRIDRDGTIWSVLLGLLCAIFFIA